MKRASSIIGNSIIITSLFFSSNSTRATNDWTNKEYIGIGIAAAGCMYGMYYLAGSARDQYHSHVMNKARETIDKSKSITYENSSENSDDEKIRLKLEEYKKDLNARWIFLYQKGLNVGVSVKFSGTMSAANVFCYNLMLSGQGFLNTSMVSNATNLDGDFIVENSQLGTVDLDGATQFASFNNCLIDDIKSKNGAIIELQNSIVRGSIILDKSGAVVIDKESIISGFLVNGRLVKNN